MITFLTVAQTAELCCLTPDAIYQAIKRGKLEAVKFGKQWAIEPEEAERYRDAPRKRGPKPKAVECPTPAS